MEIICYACGKGEMPENTMEAIEHCQTTNKDWRIEMDIHMTKDGEVVLFHDDNLERITSVDFPISRLSFEQLKLQNAGYHFFLDGQYPYREKEIQIPSLIDVFLSYPNGKFLIDIHCGDDRIVDLLIEIIESFENGDNIVFVSKYHHILSSLRNKRPHWDYGFSLREAKRLLMINALRLNSFFSFDSDIVMLPIKHNSKTIISPRLASTIHKAGKKLWLWLEEGDKVRGVDSLVEMEKARSFNADGIFTFFPQRLKRVLK